MLRPSRTIQGVLRALSVFRIEHSYLYNRVEEHSTRTQSIVEREKYCRTGSDVNVVLTITPRYKAVHGHRTGSNNSGAEDVNVGYGVGSTPGLDSL